MQPKLCSSTAALLAVAIFSVILIFVPNINYTRQINHRIVAGGDDRNTTLQLRRQQEIQLLPIGGGAIGPETFAFGGDGGPFTGVSDGRVLRWIGAERRWTDFAVTSATREKKSSFNFAFPNGVAITHDGQSILVVETTNGRVLKYHIESGELKPFAQLDGYPDNIRRSPRGGYWVGMYSKRTKLLEWVVSNPWIGKSLTKLVPFGVISRVDSYLAEANLGLGVRLSEDGECLESFNESDEYEELKSISEVMEKDGELWVGSVDLPFAAKVCCS